MSKSTRRVRRSREEIRKLVAEFRGSELSQTEFAESVGVHSNTVGKWLRQEGAEKEKGPTAQTVVAVTVKSSSEEGDATGLELVLENGRTIRVGQKFDKRTLAELIEVLDGR